MKRRNSRPSKGEKRPTPTQARELAGMQAMFGVRSTNQPAGACLDDGIIPDMQLPLPSEKRRGGK